MAADEIESVQVVEVENYETRKGRTWEFLDSSSSKWCAAEIKDFEFVEGHGDVPIYHIGSIIRKPCDSPGFSFKTEFVHDEADYIHVNTPNTTMLGSVCELCGHGIRFQHILINYSEKKWMIVGSECISHHHGEVVRKALKIFKDNKIRREFDEIRPKAIAYLDTKIDKSSAWAIQNKRLEYWAWKAKMGLLDIETEKTGSRKLGNSIKKMKMWLGIKEEV